MTRREPHLCHAHGCKVPVKRSMLMCSRHWRMVPKPLQRAVWDNYVTGQEHGMTVTAEYLAAARSAIEFVRSDERERAGPPRLFNPSEEGV